MTPVAFYVIEGTATMVERRRVRERTGNRIEGEEERMWK